MERLARQSFDGRTPRQEPWTPPSSPKHPALVSPNVHPDSQSQADHPDLDAPLDMNDDRQADALPQRRSKNRYLLGLVALALLIVYLLIPGAPGSLSWMARLGANQEMQLQELEQSLQQLEEETQALHAQRVVVEQSVPEPVTAESDGAENRSPNRRRLLPLRKRCFHHRHSHRHPQRSRPRLLRPWKTAFWNNPAKQSSRPHRRPLNPPPPQGRNQTRRQHHFKPRWDGSTSSSPAIRCGASAISSWETRVPSALWQTTTTLPILIEFSRANACSCPSPDRLKARPAPS